MRHLRIVPVATAFSLVFAICVMSAQAGIISLDPNNANESVTLADLINNDDSVTVGDKTFSEFFYSTLPNDDMPDAEDINVFGLRTQTAISASVSMGPSSTFPAVDPRMLC